MSTILEQKQIELQQRNIPVAQKLDDDIYLNIYVNTLTYRTSGPIYRLKVEPIGEDSKRDYYIQRDTLSGKLVTFAVGLKRGFDIRSLMSHPKIISVDVKHATRMLMYILFIETALLMFLTSMLILPPEYAAMLEPYFNIPTMAGYVSALLILGLMLYRESLWRRAWYGNFRVLAQINERFRVLIDGKIVTFSTKVLIIDLYESEKASVREVFGYGPKEIAEAINKDLKQKVIELESENVRLQQEIERLNSIINSHSKELDSVPEDLVFQWSLGYEAGLRASKSRCTRIRKAQTMWGMLLPGLLKLAMIIVLGIFGYFIINNVQFIVPSELTYVTYAIVFLFAAAIFLAIVLILRSKFEYSLVRGAKG